MTQSVSLEEQVNDASNSKYSWRVACGVETVEITSCNEAILCGCTRKMLDGNKALEKKVCLVRHLDTSLFVRNVPKASAKAWFSRNAPPDGRTICGVLMEMRSIILRFGGVATIRDISFDGRDAAVVDVAVRMAAE